MVQTIISNSKENQNILIYEPPFTKSKTEDQLREFIGEKLHLDISSNSVTTERIIRDMSSVAATTTSAERRDGLILSDSSGMLKIGIQLKASFVFVL